jgi:hypothetical protein
MQMPPLAGSRVACTTSNPGFICRGIMRAIQSVMQDSTGTKWINGYWPVKVSQSNLVHFTDSAFDLIYPLFPFLVKTSGSWNCR